MNNLQQEVERLKHKIKPPYHQFVEVDEGWYQLIIDCDKELSEIDPKYDLLQIKEKFGCLRYYFQPSDGGFREKMDAVVNKYEKLASETCEATGGQGVLMKSVGNWYKTLNPEYAASTLHYAKYTEVNKATKDTEENL